MGNIVGLIPQDEKTVNVCPHCGKEYKTAEALAKHIKDKHPKAAAGHQEQ